MYESLPPEGRPLLAPEDPECDFPPPNRNGLASSTKVRPGPSSMSNVDLVLAALLPWAIFTTVVWVFIREYYVRRWLVWSIVAFLLLVGALLMARGAGRGNSAHLSVGLLCLAAACTGTSVGVYLYDSYASTYWQLKDGAEYRNVMPASKGTDFADATMLSFTQDAFVDGTRTLGYMEAGVVYCVAPVAAQQFSSMPQYWAAGKDCCDQRGNFRCGDAGNPAAKTGLLIQNEKDREKYKTAIRMAEAVYNLSPTETGRFALTWTATTDNTLKEDLWSSFFNLFLLTSSLYLVCSVIAALLLRHAVNKMF